MSSPFMSPLLSTFASSAVSSHLSNPRICALLPVILPLRTTAPLRISPYPSPTSLSRSSNAIPHPNISFSLLLFLFFFCLLFCLSPLSLLSLSSTNYPPNPISQTYYYVLNTRQPDICAIGPKTGVSMRFWPYPDILLYIRETEYGGWRRGGDLYGKRMTKRME